MGTHGIDALQEGVAKNVEGHATSGLDTSVNHAIAGIGEGEIFLLNRKLVASDGKCDNGKLVRSGAGREDVALLSRIVLGAGDGIIDCLARSIGNQGQSGPGICDGGVTGLADSLSIHGGRSRVELPEALGVIDRCVLNLLAGSSYGILVNVPERVEALALVGVVGIPP